MGSQNVGRGRMNARHFNRPGCCLVTSADSKAKAENRLLPSNGIRPTTSAVVGHRGLDTIRGEAAPILQPLAIDPLVASPTRRGASPR